MKNQLRFGKWKYVGFIVLDLLCIVVANLLAEKLYLVEVSPRAMKFHYRVTALMAVINLLVIIVFNTFNCVLRRRNRIEAMIGLKQVTIGFLVLTGCLFLVKRSEGFSRVTIILAYAIYFVLSGLMRTVLKYLMRFWNDQKKLTRAFLMTTDAFLQEGLNELKKSDIDPVGILLLKNNDKDHIDDLEISADMDEAIARICWGYVGCVYVFGIDYHIIPQALTKACKDMKIEIKVIFSDYSIINLNTRKGEEHYGSLSFVEAKRDIPFPIRRVYWITETEAGLHRGFHSHKLNCQLLFCPRGKINIILDNGKEKDTVCLDEPNKGLLLMPGLWREMVWEETDSVLCVLASEYYNPDEYIRDYDQFLASKGVIDEHTIC